MAPTDIQADAKQLIETPQAVRCVGMIGGDGEDSYVKNSSWQQILTTNCFKILRECVERMPLPEVRTVALCDLGCSSGPNTFTNIQNLVEVLLKRYKESEQEVPSFQVFLNDLPSNDFNTLFKFLDIGTRPFCTAVIPGSFYDRLSPPSSMHLFLSTHSLHHLSEISAELTDKNSPAYNGDRFWVEGSNVHVIEAYRRGAADHMKRFLDARAVELVSGGLLLTVFGGRAKGSCHSNEYADWLRPLDEDEDSTPIPGTRILEYAWQQMVAEGLITKEQLATFNWPFFSLSVDDLKDLLNKYRDVFSIEALDEVMTSYIQDPPLPDEVMVKAGEKAIQAAFGLPFQIHLGERLTDILFKRYSAILLERIRKCGYDSIIPVVSNNVMVLRRL